MLPLHYRDNHAGNTAILWSVDVYVGFPGQFSRVFTGWVSSHIHNLYIYAIDGHTFVSGMKLKEYAYIYIYIYLYIYIYIYIYIYTYILFQNKLQKSTPYFIPDERCMTIYKQAYMVWNGILWTWDFTKKWCRIQDLTGSGKRDVEWYEKKVERKILIKKVQKIEECGSWTPLPDPEQRVPYTLNVLITESRKIIWPFHASQEIQNKISCSQKNKIWMHAEVN